VAAVVASVDTDSTAVGAHGTASAGRSGTALPTGMKKMSYHRLSLE
jgi:hypothetical protein